MSLGFVGRIIFGFYDASRQILVHKEVVLGYLSSTALYIWFFLNDLIDGGKPGNASELYLHLALALALFSPVDLMLPSSELTETFFVS